MPPSKPSVPIVIPRRRTRQVSLSRTGVKREIGILRILRKLLQTVLASVLIIDGPACPYDYLALDNEAIGIYHSLSAQGVKAHYYHRTLEEYLDAFLATGLRLAQPVDVAAPAGRPWRLPPECRFPLFMVLAFDKA